MKKIVLLLSAIFMSNMGFAQKTTIKSESFSDTQARMVEVTARSYVRPLIVDMVVAKGQARKVYNKSYNRTEVEVAMGGNLDNLRSRVIYDATTDWNCDAVVAATFKIELNPDGSGYSVEMKGFPRRLAATLMGFASLTPRQPTGLPIPHGSNPLHLPQI